MSTSSTVSERLNKIRVILFLSSGVKLCRINFKKYYTFSTKINSKSNGASCLTDGMSIKCQCRPGFQGDLCQVCDACVPNPVNKSFFLCYSKNKCSPTSLSSFYNYLSRDSISVFSHALTLFYKKKVLKLLLASSTSLIIFSFCSL